MLKVFIADDEPFIIEGLFDMIDWASLGLEIVGHAENGRLALEALAHTPADILITDISMPVMNGLELIAAARERQPNLKVIVLSAYSEFDYLREGMKLGIENYLLKPINVTELKETLSNTVMKLNSQKAETLLSDYGIQLMKDNTLYRWLTGSMAEEEFHERAAMLGIELASPYTAAVVVRGDPESAERSDRLLAAVSAALGGERTCLVFRDMDGDIVVLAGFDDRQADKTALLQTLSALRNADPGERPFRLSSGRIHESPQASASYREAKKAQEYFLIYPEWEWIDYGDPRAFSQASLSEFPIDWQAYAKLLVAKDSGKLAALIAGDFERLRRMEGVTPSYLQEIALELIVRFKMELKEIKRTEEPELFAAGFEGVRNAADFNALAEAVRGVAARCVESLVRDTRSPVVLQVLNVIHERYADELSLKMLGAQFHIHPVYLGQLFIKETNESFTEYINKYRIEKAKELLRTTHHKVHEIARLVGYWETGYFYKQFKKYVGVSPTEFKALV
jgi:two-component system response regulator YesN